jgi:HEAT repeat protein
MKRKALVAGTVVLAALVAWAWLLRRGERPEPVYQGRPLGAWLDDRHATSAGPVVLSDEAVTAVRAMGPEAIPTLLDWIRAPDSAISRSAKVFLEWRLRLPVHVPTNHEKRARAMYGFRALGVAARSAFPELVKIALHSSDEWQRADAINALCESDADAMRGLVEGLENPDREVRLRAIHALACVRIAPDEVCLPALERAAASDPDASVRDSAAREAAFILQELSAVATALNNSDPKIRAAAASFVGGFRTRARSYLPALEAAAHDPDASVREATAEAIRQVRGEDPEAGR